MTGTERFTLDLLRDVLRPFDVVPESIAPVPSGEVNRHWRVSTNAGEFALRRYTPHRSPVAIAYEHAVLDHLAGRQWPVAPALPSIEGETVVEHGDARWALFPWLPGEPASYGDHAALRLKGETLARLHHDLAAWPGGERRDGVGRLMELDILAQSLGQPSMRALLDRIGAEQPDLVERFGQERTANLQELVDTGFYALPLTVVHGDFCHGNVLFDNSELSGVLDFDWVHQDVRVADLARSLWLDCRIRRGTFELDRSAMTAWLAGYAAESALTADEHSVIVPLLRTFVLYLAAYDMARWLTGEEPDLVRVEAELTVALPLLREQGDALKRVVDMTLHG